MLINLVLFAFLYSVVIAVPTATRSATPWGWCPHGPSLSSLKAAAESDAFAGRLIPRANKNATIPIYWNVIYADETLKGGYISDTMIQDQINVLNKDYENTFLQFNLANIRRVQNVTWFNDADPYTDVPQDDMKRQLRDDSHGPSHLFVYSLGMSNVSQPGTLGASTFPDDYHYAPYRDGILLRYDALPGGNTIDNSLGRVLTHEIGHWVGLLHTFQGGCTEPGDEVDDTPPEASPAFDCETGRKTCENSPGVDPIHNFMDYTADSCRTEFTPGQIQRLRSQISRYRDIIT